MTTTLNDINVSIFDKKQMFFHFILFIIFSQFIQTLPTRNARIVPYSPPIAATSTANQEPATPITPITFNTELSDTSSHPLRIPKDKIHPMVTKIARAEPIPNCPISTLFGVDGCTRLIELNEVVAIDPTTYDFKRDNPYNIRRKVVNTLANCLEGCITLLEAIGL